MVLALSFRRAVHVNTQQLFSSVILISSDWKTFHLTAYVEFNLEFLVILRKVRRLASVNGVTKKSVMIHHGLVVHSLNLLN